MTKIIFGIFAHPDDESFGAAGTLLTETRAGTQLHLISLTAGGAGMNPDGHAGLDDARLKEWADASRLLGAAKTYYLGYPDGQLNNTSLQEAATRISNIIRQAVAMQPANAVVELMAFDFTGLSGHIDHIVASRAAALVFYRLKAKDPRITRLRLLCLSRADSPEVQTEWLFREAGRTAEEIDETVDARGLKDDIVTIMRIHQSQRHDADRIIAHRGDRLGLDHFIVLR